MKHLILTAAAGLIAAGSAFAEGDVADGEKDFKKCKACHALIDDDGNVIVKGGKTGPNLYGVIGRAAAGVEDFKYGESIVAAGAGGLIWTEEEMVKYLLDPKAYLKEVTGDDGAKSKMTFKLKDGEDVAAYLASLSPMAMEGDDDAEGEGEEESDDASTDSN
jgi:cytochrome c